MGLFFNFIYLFWLHWVFVAMHRLLVLVASLVAERELELHGLQELLGSVAVTLGL